MERLDWTQAIELFAQVDKWYLDRCHEITELRKQLAGKWVSVEERLPEAGDQVLVTVRSGRITVGIWHGHTWSSPYRYGEPVAAWMPLPEPYKHQNLGGKND